MVTRIITIMTMIITIATLASLGLSVWALLSGA